MNTIWLKEFHKCQLCLCLCILIEIQLIVNHQHSDQSYWDLLLRMISWLAFPWFQGAINCLWMWVWFSLNFILSKNLFFRLSREWWRKLSTQCRVFREYFTISQANRQEQPSGSKKDINSCVKSNSTQFWWLIKKKILWWSRAISN